MTVDIGEQWTQPHPFALTGPADWRPTLSRQIFHETVHYWQFIGHAHLIHLVEEDWTRLCRFDATGEVASPGPLRRQFLAPDKGAGFSAHDLMECHARVWDVHALGPPSLIELELDDPHRDTSEVLTRDHYDKLKAEGKIWHHVDESGRGVGYSSLSLDLAMRMAAGRYALPYLTLQDATNDLVAGALFPLCAHFALHSNSPVKFYLAMLKRVTPKIQLVRNQPIEIAWRALYFDLLVEALRLHKELFDTEFLTGQAAMHESPLYGHHVGYRLSHTLLSQACDHITAHRPKDFLIGPENMPAAMRALWTMDFLLGCCGMTTSRWPDLLAYLSPPVVRFDDGKTWTIGTEFDRMPYESGAPATAVHPVPRAQVAMALLAVDQRWNDLQLKALGL